MGIINNDLMHYLDMWNLDGKPCLLVVKNGNITGTIIGHANGIFSTVYNYFNNLFIN